MNRVLSWPHTRIVPGLLDELKNEGKRRTVVTDKGMIRFELSRGLAEMHFSDAQQQLPPGTDVFVWWKVGGFVCAPTSEIEAEERASRDITEQVQRARALLAQARKERESRLTKPIDLALPLESRQEEPISIY